MKAKVFLLLTGFVKLQFKIKNALLSSFKNRRNKLLDFLDENNLLSFDNLQVILKVSQFREQQEKQLQIYAEPLFLKYGIMRENSRYSAFGQSNTLSWTFYPSEGRDCELLILGEKDWRKGKIKVFGSFELSEILEEFPKTCDFSGMNSKYDTYEGRLRSMIQAELRSRNINDFKEIFNLKITLEFIPEQVKALESNEIAPQESPLDDIRKSIAENPL